MTETIANVGTFWPLQPVNGTHGSSIKMASNFFQIYSESTESLYAYKITYEPELQICPVHDQAKVERQLNDQLKNLAFSPFFCKGSKLYSRTKSV